MCSKSANLGFWFGLILSLFLLVGKWSFQRFTEDGGLPILALQPRFWAMILLVFIVLKSSSSYRTSWLNILSPLAHSLFFAAAIFLFYTLFSAVWSVALSMKYEPLVIERAVNVLFVLAMLLSIYFASQSLSVDDMRRGVWFGIMWIGLILGLAAIVGMGTGGRLAALGGGPNAFGRNMALLCVASMYFSTRSKRIWLWVVVWVISFLLIILSGSRGALLSGSIGIGMAFLFMRMSLSRKLSAIFAVSVILVAIVSFTPVGSQLMNRFYARFVELTIEQQHTSGRGLLFQQAIDIGLDYPLFGAGLGGFPALTNSVYPHNIFLEAFSEGGAVGLFLFCMTMFIFALFLYRHRHYLDLFSFCAFIIFFVFSQFSGSLFDARGAFMFMAICVLPSYFSISQKHARAVGGSCHQVMHYD